MSREAQQTTVARPVTKKGIGLHSGAKCAVALLPAEPDAGIVFICESGVALPATVDHVVGTDRSTTLGLGEARVRSVEHLLAALYGLAVDNVSIQVQGPEVPACDGSAQEWVEVLGQAGRKRLGARRKTGTLAKAVWVTNGDAWAVASPARNLAVGVGVEYPGTAAARQTFWVSLARGQFASQVAPARTFCLRREYEALLAAGLGKGGRLENTFVVDADGYSGPLRFPDEVVRHKTLDVIGDIALGGWRLAAHIVTVRPSHRMNVELARAVRGALSPGGGTRLEGGGRSE